MDISEHHVLGIIYLEGHLKREGLSNYINRIISAVSPPQAQSVDQYENAIDSCLDKSFLKVLTIEDCNKDKERWLEDDNQSIDEHPYIPGNLDFTISGAKIYNDFLDTRSDDKKLHGKNTRAVYYKWKNDGVLSFITKLKKDITSELKKLQEPGILGDGEQIIDIGNPYSIGPWWVTRFDRLNKGWRVDIKYK